MTWKKRSSQPELEQEQRAVAQLIRVSTLQQAQEGEYGIAAQEDACEKIAREHNLNIAWHYQIEGVSGAELRRSPKMQELLRLIDSGLCEGVVMSEQSRVMRKVDSDFFQLLEDNGAMLYCADGASDYRKPGDKLMGQMKGAFAEYERHSIRIRTTGGRARKRKGGEWPSGKNAVALGLELCKVDGRDVLRVDESEIGKVKDLFKFFIDGSGFTSFAKLSKMSRVPVYSVPYVLSNELYTGWHVIKRKSDPKGKVFDGDGVLKYQRRKAVPRAEQERIKMLAGVPPISAEQFKLAQSLLEQRKEMHVKVKKDAEDNFLFRGLLHCADCGRRLITLRYTNKKANNFFAEYYVCIGAHGARSEKGVWRIKNGTCPTRRIRREVLEQILSDKIVRTLSNPNLLADIMASSKKSQGDNPEERAEQLTKEIAKYERAIEKNYSARLLEEVSDELYQKHRIELTAKLKVARGALAHLKPSLSELSLKEWTKIAKTFRTWKKLQLPEQRKCLAAIGAQFLVSGRAGAKYHETIVNARSVQINRSVNSSNESIEVSFDDEDSSNPSLVDIEKHSYSSLDSNQSDMCLTS